MHNLNYWNGGVYLGLGPSAHSYDGKFRTANPYIYEYIKENPPQREEIDKNKALKEYIMLRLRKREGIFPEDMCCRFGEKTARIFTEEAYNLGLDVDKRRIRIPQKRLFVSDAIILSLISHLPNQLG